MKERIKEKERKRRGIEAKCLDLRSKKETLIKRIVNQSDIKVLKKLENAMEVQQKKHRREIVGLQ